MKIISFNINGLRARPHQLYALLEKHQPEVVGLQEIKVEDAKFPYEIFENLGYEVFHHGQKGHYGVAMLCKQKPLAVRKGFASDDENSQKRLIAIDLQTSIGVVSILNGYFPQGESRDHPTKFPNKMKFYQDLQDHLQNDLLKNNEVIVMGDFNIAPIDLDIGIGPINAKRWLQTGKCAFLPEERACFAKLCELGLEDSFRKIYPAKEDAYSWFDYRSRGFDDNRGLRIDLVLASQKLSEKCINAGIDLEIRAMEKPSDHAPVWAEFDI